MNYKLFVLVVLFGCVFAEDKISPKSLDCAFHIVEYEEDSAASTNSTHEYFGLVNSYGGNLKVIDKDTGFVTLIRCDDEKGDKCFMMKYDSKNKSDCRPDYVYIRSYLPSSIPQVIVYDNPETAVDCPDGTINGCTEYCDLKDLCYTLDGNGHVVMKRKGSVVVTLTYDNDVTVEDFAGSKCDGTPLSAPSDNCVMVTFTPHLDCAFNFQLDHVTLGRVDYMGYFNGDYSSLIMKTRMVGESTYQLYRCDAKDNNKKCSHQTFDDANKTYCVSQPLSIDEVHMVLSGVFISVEYNKTVYPLKDVTCPDRINKDCSKYCGTTMGAPMCLTVDNKNRAVECELNDVRYFSVKHFDEPLSPEEFTGNICTGGTFSTPDDPCPVIPSRSSSSTKPSNPSGSSSTKPINPSSGSSSTKPTTPSSSAKPAHHSSSVKPASHSVSSASNVKATLAVVFIAVIFGLFF